MRCNRSSRFVNTLERVSGGLDGEESMAVSQNGSNVETNPGNGGNGQDSLFSDSIDFPNLVRYLDPQQWTNPINMDWDQWDPIIASLGIAPWIFGYPLPPQNTATSLSWFSSVSRQYSSWLSNMESDNMHSISLIEAITERLMGTKMVHGLSFKWQCQERSMHSCTVWS